MLRFVFHAPLHVFVWWCLYRRNLFLAGPTSRPVPQVKMLLQAGADPAGPITVGSSGQTCTSHPAPSSHLNQVLSMLAFGQIAEMPHKIHKIAADPNAAGLNAASVLVCTRARARVYVRVSVCVCVRACM